MGSTDGFQSVDMKFQEYQSIEEYPITNQLKDPNNINNINNPAHNKNLWSIDNSPYDKKWTEKIL